MKLLQLVFIVFAGIFFSMCGEPTPEKEDTQTSPTFANYVSYGNSDDVVLPASQTGNENNKIILHTKTDKVSGITIYEIPLPANWKLTSNGMVGPDGIQVIKSDIRALDPSFSNFNCIDDLIQFEITPSLFREGKKVKNVVELPGIAENNQRSLSMFCTPGNAKHFQEVKGLEVEDAQGNKGFVIVQFMSAKMGSNVSIQYMTTELTANADRFNQAKFDLIFGMRNKRLNPDFVAYTNFKAKQTRVGKDTMSSQPEQGMNYPRPTGGFSMEEEYPQWGGHDCLRDRGLRFRDPCKYEIDGVKYISPYYEPEERFDNNPPREGAIRDNSSFTPELSPRQEGFMDESERFNSEQETFYPASSSSDLELRQQIRQELFGDLFENGEIKLTPEEAQFVEQAIEEELQRRKSEMRNDNANQLISPPPN